MMTVYMNGRNNATHDPGNEMGSFSKDSILRRNDGRPVTISGSLSLDSRNNRGLYGSLSLFLFLFWRVRMKSGNVFGLFLKGKRQVLVF
jgi:hypothetical protein